MSRLEADRAKMGSHLNKLNQVDTKLLAERRRRFDGTQSKKGSRAEQRRAQDEEFVQFWISRQSESSLDLRGRFNLALKRGNDGDVELIFNNLNDAEGLGYKTTVFIRPAVSTDDTRIA